MTFFDKQGRPSKLKPSRPFQALIN